jgi:glc operon protein GlcG
MKAFGTGAWCLALLVSLPANAQSDLVDRVPNISSEGAAIALRGASERAQANQSRVSIAIVDMSGNLVAFERLGNAIPASIENAIEKARTAAQLGQPSKVLQDIVDGGSTSYLAVKGLSALQGGVPLKVDGVLVGGIGTSGGAAEADEAISNVGADALAAAAGSQR